MPRIKYYNKNTNQWEYADSQYAIGGTNGGDVFCVTVEGSSHNGYTADKTAAEVYEAYTSGKSVVCKVHDFDGNFAMSLAIVTPSVVLFNCTVLGSLFTLVISDSDNTVEFNLTQLVTEDDVETIVNELDTYVDELIDEKLAGFVPDSGGNVDKVTLTSPDGSKWNLTVDNAGNVGAVKVTSGDSGTEEPDEPVVTAYTVTSGLTNVESTSPSAVVNEGASYTAILTAVEGYELDSVIVTMGGVDITATAYVDGVVTIPNVTDNVVITATAIEVANIEYHTMTLEDASATSVSGSKIAVRGYNNADYANVLVPSTMDSKNVEISTSYPGTSNFNVSGNIENLTFEENSTVTGELKISGDSLKTIKNIPSTVTGLVTTNSVNLEYVSGLENNAVLKTLTMTRNSSLKYPPVLNTNAPLTSLKESFSNCTGMEYDISNWRIPSSVTNINQMFRNCSGVSGNFLIDRNYTSNNCSFAFAGTSVKEVTVTDTNFSIPWQALTGVDLTDYTPLYGDNPSLTKQYKINMYRDSEMYRTIREAYAGEINGILKYDFECIDGYVPSKNITFYGDSQLRPYGGVTSQLLPKMSDDVFLWNLAVGGASSESYKPIFAKFPERYSDVTVLWLITNDTGITGSTMNNIKHYVDSLKTDKYIVLGVWFYHYEELKFLNEQLRATYGNRYFDVHQYTLDNWERITGITPTEADITAVANDTVPPSLIHTDGVHENEAGGLVIATGIKEKLMELGYIDNTWFKTATE